MRFNKLLMAAIALTLSVSCGGDSDKKKGSPGAQGSGDDVSGSLLGQAISIANSIRDLSLTSPDPDNSPDEERVAAARMFANLYLESYVKTVITTMRVSLIPVTICAEASVEDMTIRTNSKEVLTSFDSTGKTCELLDTLKFVHYLSCGDSGFDSDIFKANPIIASAVGATCDTGSFLTKSFVTNSPEEGESLKIFSSTLGADGGACSFKKQGDHRVMTKDCVLSQQMSQGDQVSDQFGSNVVITMKSGLKAASYADVTFESFPVDGRMTIRSGGWIFDINFSDDAEPSFVASSGDLSFTGSL